MTAEEIVDRVRQVVRGRRETMPTWVRFPQVKSRDNEPFLLAARVLRAYGFYVHVERVSYDWKTAMPGHFAVYVALRAPWFGRRWWHRFIGERARGS